MNAHSEEIKRNCEIGGVGSSKATMLGLDSQQENTVQQAFCYHMFGHFCNSSSHVSIQLER